VSYRSANPSSIGNRMSNLKFPNESVEYRAARNALLVAETNLRGQIEEVARLRRELPAGGILQEDYQFQELVEGGERNVSFSDLFDQHDTLFVYSFMYSDDMKSACSLCTALLDALDAQVSHIEQNISVAVVAKSPVQRIDQHAQQRVWKHLRLLSSDSNSYNTDYFGETDGRQMTFGNIFVRKNGEVRHFWGSELAYEPAIEGGHMRHLDMIWPLWGVLDLTPDGRRGFMPKLDY